MYDGYLKEIGRLGYVPTWLPNEKITVGSLLRFDARGHEGAGTLAAYGIDFRTTPRTQGIDLTIASSSGVSTVTKLAGTAPAQGSALTTAEAGVSVGFMKAKTVYFSATDCELESIDDVAALEMAVRNRYRTQQWDTRLAIVVQVVHARRLVALMAEEAGASAEIGCSAQVREMKFETAPALRAHRHLAVQAVGEGSFTPLFKIRALKPFFLDLKPPRFLRDETVAFEDVSAGEVDEVYFRNGSSP